VYIIFRQLPHHVQRKPVALRESIACFRRSSRARKHSMTGSSQPDSTIERLIRWAMSSDNVRAILLTSTRAVPGAPLDALSDYDVILVARDIQPFVADRSWLSTFGNVLVAYWDPFDPATSTGASNVVQYEDRLKIDFGIWPIERLVQITMQPSPHPELDAGYRILLDRDGIAAKLPPPTHTAYIPKPPDEDTFLVHINDFFSDVPYVAKCLLRDELLPARWCLDYDMRYVYLLPMLEWRMECDHNWSVSTGNLGKGLKKRLPPDIWAEVESTFAGAGIEETWQAMFRMIDLFRRTGQEVAADLGYDYPIDLDRRVTSHALRMRSGELGLTTDD
jgi:aminoglycoside 6-adenylyltransferase